MRHTNRNAVFIYLSLLNILTSPGVTAFPQQATVFQGAWTATVDPSQVFRGMWSAQLRAANSAQGSWTLLNEAGEVTLQGTWSATKVGGAWQGTWSARPSSGGTYSGNWNADLPAVVGKTLQDMLQRTSQKQVAGSWRSGRYAGNWWLDGFASRPRK